MPNLGKRGSRRSNERVTKGRKKKFQGNQYSNE